MDRHYASEQHDHADIEVLHTFFRLLFLEIEHRVLACLEVSIDDLGHKLAYFENFIAVEPIGKMPTEVGPCHQHKSLRVVEDPSFTKVQVRIEVLPHEYNSDEQVADADDFEYAVDEDRIVCLS